MDPPGRLGSLEAAAPSAEDIGAPITPSINTRNTGVILPISLPPDDGSVARRLMIVLVPPDLPQDAIHRLRTRFDSSAATANDPFPCENWSAYMADVIKGMEQVRPFVATFDKNGRPVLKPAAPPQAATHEDEGVPPAGCWFWTGAPC